MVRTALGMMIGVSEVIVKCTDISIEKSTQLEKGLKLTKNGDNPKNRSQIKVICNQVLITCKCRIYLEHKRFKIAIVVLVNTYSGVVIVIVVGIISY
jgi:hypothetical protein